MSLRNLLLVGLALALALLVALGAMTLGATKALVATQEEVRRTDAVIQASSAVRSAVHAVTAAAEADAPSPDPEAPGPYRAARTNLDRRLLDLGEAAAEEAVLAREVKRLLDAITPGLRGIDAVRDQQRAAGDTEGFVPLVRHRTLPLEKEAGTRLGAVDETARNLLRERSERMDVAARESAFATGVLLVVGAAFLILLVGLLIHHMTKLKRSHEETTALNRDLAARQDDLERANRELDAFNYSVSHDLRAPLRTIDGFAQMVLEDQGERLGEEGRSHLGVVRSETRRMGALLEGLLTLSRSQRTEFHAVPVDLAEVVRAAVERARAAEPGRAVEVAVGPLPTVPGDPTLLPQVFVNLVGNAFKYTRGRERAEIRIEAHPEGTGHEITVADNGIGFSSDDAKRLFGVFSRLTRDERFEGVGVGLAIVDRIVRRHGGRVRAEGEPDRGATFSVWLPA